MKTNDCELSLFKPYLKPSSKSKSVKIRILHVITGLNDGGAESMLIKLISKSDYNKFEHLVISLMTPGKAGERLRELNIPHLGLGVQRGRLEFYVILRIAKLIKLLSPDIVHSWLYHSDFVAGIAGSLTNAKCLWCLRHSNIYKDKFTTKVLVFVCGFLSHFLPKKIVACSNATVQSHLGYFYSRDKMVLIHNGFDVERFRPDSNAKDFLAKKLGFDSGHVFVGLAGRYCSVKGYDYFFEAAGMIVKSFPFFKHSFDRLRLHLGK